MFLVIILLRIIIILLLYIVSHASRLCLATVLSCKCTRTDVVLFAPKFNDAEQSFHSSKLKMKCFKNYIMGVRISSLSGIYILYM